MEWRQLIMKIMNADNYHHALNVYGHYEYNHNYVRVDFSAFDGHNYE